MCRALCMGFAHWGPWTLHPASLGWQLLQVLRSPQDIQCTLRRASGQSGMPGVAGWGQQHLLILTALSHEKLYSQQPGGKQLAWKPRIDPHSRQ